MRSIALLLTLKILSLVGATLNTLGFLTFFFFDGLAPWRWHLIVGGVALIAVAELASRALARRMAAGSPDDGDDEARAA